MAVGKLFKCCSLFLPVLTLSLSLPPSLVKATLEIKASQYQQRSFKFFYCLLKCDWKDETDFYANTIHFQRRRRRSTEGWYSNKIISVLSVHNLVGLLVNSRYVMRAHSKSGILFRGWYN